MPHRWRARTGRTGPRTRAAWAWPSLLVPHELPVARVELVIGVQPAWITRRQRHADRPAVADHERRLAGGTHVVERGHGARHVLAQRLPVGEPEGLAGVEPGLPA